MSDSFLKKNLRIYKTRGIKGVTDKFLNMLLPLRIKGYSQFQKYFLNKSGIEIGGPSHIFSDKGRMPLYKYIKGLDGCNYSNNTMWEGEIKDNNYHFAKNKKGVQFISEAIDINKGLTQRKYDFLISSNCLEHIANPLKAIENWKNLLNEDGLMLLILPNKNANFDHKRDYTPFEHLVDDYIKNIGEDDLTHKDEIIKNHDLILDYNGGTMTEFEERCNKNLEFRGLHHHVFNIETLSKMYQYFNIEVLITQDIKTDYLILGRVKK
jgi:SAM-dependent methyltransferase